jgi:hypothetical protein
MSSPRAISASLWQNLGTGQPGSSFSLAGRTIGVGKLSRSADEQLTKVTPADLTLKVEDNDGGLWTFLKDQISIAGGLLPPYLLVDVDGTRRFLGVVNPKGLQIETKSREVQIVAQDWSIQLSAITLGIVADGSTDPEWQRPGPKAASNRTTDQTKNCSVEYGWQAGLVGWLDKLSWAGPNDWLQSGDKVTTSILPGKTYRVSTVADSYAYLPGLGADIGASPSAIAAVMAMNPNIPFTRHGSVSGNTSTTYYSVASDVAYDSNTPTYILPLDTTDGIAAGDKIGLILGTSSATWTVLNVDAELNQVITREPIGRALTAGNHIYFTPETQAELVFEDARTILYRAVMPYRLDISRLIAPVLPDPVLAFLPLRPAVGEDLRGVADVEPGLTDLRVIAGDGQTWDGTPAIGWTAVPGTPAKRAIWTDQLTTAPATLMPDETAALNVLARRRNRGYADFKLQQVDNGFRGSGQWTPALGAAVGLIVVHDYPQMRRLKCTGSTVVSNAWSGTAWGADMVQSWSGGAILSACIVPGLPGALLARTDAGLVLGLGASGTCAIPAEAAGGILTTTPWGAYLVSAQGYGRVDCTATSVTLHWVTLTDAVTGFYPSTLAGITPDELVMLGRFDTSDAQGNALTETHFFRLTALPVTGDARASVVFSEKVTDGAPSLIGCFRDPTKMGRVIGQIGGRLFQVDRELPFTLERFKPSGMAALQLVEHICQLMNAVAVPDPTGTLQVVSRTFLDQVYDLTISRVTRKVTRTWEHFYTLIRVSTSDDSQYADARGQEGGKLLEITSHPLVWTTSGCSAMAKSLAIWFGKPRQASVETWLAPDTSVVPPWEALPPIARVRVNNAATTQLVMALDENLKTREATATLVDVGETGYGLGYGQESA